ncbi:MAG: hypothetical protein J6K43_15340 [Lachnospiraceae bacterium]|nr:hypothetical protein [Lachnospiraceae bacterium]
MVTLEQAKIGREDKMYGQVIDSLRRQSPLMDKMVFDDCVSPSVGGSNLSYSYMRTKTPSTADFREIGKEYNEDTAAREQITTHLKVFGGEYKVDRVIAERPALLMRLLIRWKKRLRQPRICSTTQS